MRDLFIYLLFQLRNVRKEGVRSVKCTVVGVNMHMSDMSVCLRVSTEYEKTAKAYQRVHMGTFITLSMVYAFPCVFLCPRMSACAHVCACVHSGLPPPPASPAYVSVYVCVRVVCVRVCVCVPGEPVVGQCISPDQGYLRGGDADDRQPLRLCLPPLLLSSAHLQRLQGPPARGTTLNTHEYKHVHSTHTGPRGG